MKKFLLVIMFIVASAFVVAPDKLFNYIDSLDKSLILPPQNVIDYITAPTVSIIQCVIILGIGFAAWAMASK